jgi:hypothetical protein
MKFTSMFFKASEDYIRDSFSNIVTNERDKQSQLCYFTASAGNIRGLPSNIVTNERET